MKGVAGESKMVFKFTSRMKWIGLFGLVLSVFSIFTHLLLARYTYDGNLEYQASITIFSWRPVFENTDPSSSHPLFRRLWGPVKKLESLHSQANPRGIYEAPLQTNGYIFVRIRGGFHEIRNSICDVVVVARLLNATLVIPEIQSTTSSKGISTEFKSFAYVYNEDQFMAALADDVKIVKTLPKNLKGARRKKEIPSFRVSRSASPYFYLHHVLPVLTRHSVAELVIPDGGCLQATLPPNLEEYQRLRCRVSFHALRFRDEVEELASAILNRLRSSGRPYIAYDPGLTRDALAYYGCAELFQDVHTELIQHKRSSMIKRGIIKGNLTVDSAGQRLKGLCPLMPEEVLKHIKLKYYLNPGKCPKKDEMIGILLRAYGYSWDTIIYVSGGEVFGGQKKLLPLHAIFENVVDRTSLSTAGEMNKIYGREAILPGVGPKTPPVKAETKHVAWKSSGQRPYPLPPPPARAKYPYNIEGWWGWVAESDNEPESTVMELRTNAHKLLWEAIDYKVCVEADVFVPGFDRDGKGNPSFASLVTGHRLYQFPASKTLRLDRGKAANLFEEIRDHLYQVNQTWIISARKLLRRNIIEGLTEDLRKTRPLSFLSFPVPECLCKARDDTGKSANTTSTTPHARVLASLRVTYSCPAWMHQDSAHSTREKDEEEEDPDEDDSKSMGSFFWQTSETQEAGVGEVTSKDETPMEDQEELEGGDR